MRSRAGVTLIEMLIVVTIIGVVAGVSFPAVSSGLAGLRLSTASGTVASFLTSTMNGVERREEPASLVIAPGENRLAVFTAASGDKPLRTLQLPQGVSIDAGNLQDREPRRYLFLPGGTVPRVQVILRNDQGARRSIQIDPVTAVPDIRRMGDHDQ